MFTIEELIMAEEKLETKKALDLIEKVKAIKKIVDEVKDAKKD